MRRFNIAWIVAALAFASPAGAQQVGKRVGMFYPDLELPTIDGKQTVRLSELRGKRVLLIEFASW